MKNIANELKKNLKGMKKVIASLLIVCMVAQGTLVYCYADDFDVQPKELMSGEGGFVEGSDDPDNSEVGNINNSVGENATEENIASPSNADDEGGDGEEGSDGEEGGDETPDTTDYEDEPTGEEPADEETAGEVPVGEASPSNTDEEEGSEENNSDDNNVADEPEEGEQQGDGQQEQQENGEGLGTLFNVQEVGSEQGENNGGKSLLGGTTFNPVSGGNSTILTGFTKLPTGSKVSYTLSAGKYIVEDGDVTFAGGSCESGLIISGAVVIYVPSGKTITCTGGAASGQTGAGAGIEVPSTSTLIIYGEGTVSATGGAGAAGANGSDGTRSWGGVGGVGGGGAGAGIGTKGPSGGAAGYSAGGINQPGSSGNWASEVGQVSILGKLTVSVYGGTQSSTNATGGAKYASQNTGGGGGGGNGTNGAKIGRGGTSGAGGGIGGWGDDSRAPWTYIGGGGGGGAGAATAQGGTGASTMPNCNGGNANGVNGGAQGQGYRGSSTLGTTCGSAGGSITRNDSRSGTGKLYRPTRNVSINGTTTGVASTDLDPVDISRVGLTGAVAEDAPHITIVYNANFPSGTSGSGTAPSDSDMYTLEEVTNPGSGTLILPGYSVEKTGTDVNWYTDSDCTTQVTFPYTVKEYETTTTNFYLKWDKLASVEATTPSNTVAYGFTEGDIKIKAAETENTAPSRFKISNYKFYECSDATGTGATLVKDENVSDVKSYEYAIPNTDTADPTKQKAIGDYYYYAKITYTVDDDPTDTFSIDTNIVKATVTKATTGHWGGSTFTYDDTTNTLTITGSATSTSGTLADSMTNSFGTDIRSEIKNVKCVKDATGNLVKVGSDAGAGTFGFSSPATSSPWTSLASADLYDMDVSGANTDFYADLFIGDTSLTYIKMPQTGSSNMTSLLNTFRLIPVVSISNLSDIDTTNVTKFECTFQGSNNIEELDLSTWTASNLDTTKGLAYFLQFDASQSKLKKLTFGDNFDASSYTNWDTYKAVVNADNLQELTLGSNFFGTDTSSAIYSDVTKFGFPNKAWKGSDGTVYANTTDMLNAHKTKNALITYTKIDGAWGGCPIAFDNTTGELTITGGINPTSGTLKDALDTVYGSSPDIRASVKSVKCVLDGAGNYVKVGSDAGAATFGTSDPSYGTSAWTNLVNVDLSYMDLSDATQSTNYTSKDAAGNGFFDCLFCKSTAIRYIVMPTVGTSHMTDMYHTFFQCGVATISNINSVDVSGVQRMHTTFFGAANLVELDLSSWDTSSVIENRMIQIICNNTNLKTLKFGENFVAKKSENADTPLGTGLSSIELLMLGSNFMYYKNASDFAFPDKIWVGSDGTFYTTSTAMLAAQKAKATDVTYGEYKSLSVKTPATKSAYKIGDTFIATGSVLTAKYNDTITADIDYDTHYNDITFSPTTALTSSDKVITYTYLGKTATQEILFGSPISISYKSGPTKSAYKIGETFDPTGLTIIENYNYGLPTSDVTYDSSTSGQFAVSPAPGSLLNDVGSKSLTISYGGYSTTKDSAITVEAPSSISVATKSTITFYAAGDKFNAKGLYINRNFASASSDIVKFDDHTADFTFGPNGDFSRNTFKKTDTFVSIKYGGLITTQDITIKAINYITVTTDPTKMSYVEGQSFDPTGMKITVTYNDSSTEVIDYEPSAGITYSPTTFTTVGHYQSVTVTYDGNSAPVGLGVDVNEKTMSAISVKTVPTKTTYLEGATFDPAGLVITKTYDNGTTENVTYNNSTSGNFTFTPNLSTALNTVGTQNIDISYQDTYGSSPTTKTTTLKVVVKAKTLKSISVASKSTTTTYIEGQTFDPAGIKIYRNYDNGTKDTYDYVANGDLTYSPTSKLAKGTQTITLNYSGFTTSFTVTVNAKAVSSLTISTAPKKLIYLVGEKVNADGLVLNATYNNGDTATLTYGSTSGITYSPTAALTTSDTQITFTYGGQSVTQAITVNEVPTSINAFGSGSTMPTKTSYGPGELFDPSGLILSIPNWGGGSGGTITYSEGCGMTFNPTLDTAITSTTTQITVTYGGQTIVIPITQALLDSISVSSGPTKSSYIEGEKFDPEGLVLSLTYSDSTPAATVTYKDGCGMTYSPTTAFTTLGTNTVTINYAGKSCTKDINVVAKSVSGVSLNTVQSKRTYIEGNNYDPAGLKLNITYDNGTSEVVSYSSDTSSKFTFNPSLTTALTSDTQNITITYDGNANTVSTTVLATAKSVSSIAVNTVPTKITYIEGNAFDPAGLKLDVTYDNGTSEVITYDGTTSSSFAFNPSTFTSVGTQNVTITYGGKTVTTPVTVNAKQVSSIAVTTDPSKMTYLEGETFNPDGTVLALTYDNGTTGSISYSASSGITCDKTTLTNSSDHNTKVTFTYNEKTAQTSANLIVTGIPTSIDIDTTAGASLPNRTTFATGETFDPTGLIIHMPGNTPETLAYSETSGIEIIPSGALTSSDTIITIKYGNVTTTIPIKVKSLYEIEVDSSSTHRTTYVEGEKFDPTGLVLGLTFSDDDTGTKKYKINSGIGYSYGTQLLGIKKLLGAMLLGDSNTALTVGQQKINFTYDGHSTYTYVTVNAKTLNGINIKTAPTKVSYNEGDLFDPTGLVLGLTYDNGTTDTLSYSASSGITYDKTVALTTTDTTVTFTYSDGTNSFTATQAITVAPSIQSIAKAVDASKLTYKINESFDPTGLVLGVTYSDSTTKYVPYTTSSGMIFNPTTTFTVSGAQDVNVIYGGKTCVQGVIVTEDVAPTPSPTPTPTPTPSYSGGGSGGGGGGGRISNIVTEDQRILYDQAVAQTKKANDRLDPQNATTLVRSTNTERVIVSNGSNVNWIYEPTTSKWKLSINDSYTNLSTQTGKNVTSGFVTIAQAKTTKDTMTGVNNVDVVASTYFFDQSGEMHIGWLTTGDLKTYYFEPAQTPDQGKMVSGWKEIETKWFYFDSSGALLRNSLTPDGHKVDENGVWVK